MPRNTAGVYSLTSDNPVVAGTTILDTWANNTMNDLAQAMTDSLDRQGRGSMVAPFKLVDGTVAAPAFSFNSEPSSGIFRAGAGDVRLSVLGTLAARWTASGYEVAGTINATGAITATTSVTATTGLFGATLNVSGISAVGGALTVTGVLTGSTYVLSGALAGNFTQMLPGAFEMGNVSGTAISTGIDMHTSGFNTDYDSRIIASGGTSAASNGVLGYIANGGHNFTGAATFNTTVTISGVLNVNNLIATSGIAAAGNIQVNAGSSTAGQVLLNFVGASSVGTSFGNGAAGIVATVNNLGQATFAQVTISSDSRLKSDLAPIALASAMHFMQLPVYTYLKDGEREAGFIAQEVMAAAPELVRDGINGFLALDSGNGIAAYHHAALASVIARLNAAGL